jgi:hypothetical protein
VILEQLYRRDDLAVPGGLQEADAAEVGVQQVEPGHVDVRAAKAPAQVPRHHHVAGHRAGQAVAQEESVGQVGLAGRGPQVGLHDEVRRLAVGQPHAAHGGHHRAEHHREAHRFERRVGEEHDHHQRPDGEPDHRDAVEDAGGERHHRGYGDGRRQDVAPVSLEQKEDDALQEPRLRDYRHEQGEAEDEQHGIGMDQVVEAVPGQQMLARERPQGDPSLVGDRAAQVRGGPPDADEGGDDHHRHAVGEGVLVDAVAKRTEGKQADDGGKDFGGQQRDRQPDQAADDQQGERAERAHGDERPRRQLHDVAGPGGWGVVHPLTFRRA